MAFKKFNKNEERDFGQREMIKGNWQCEGCGAQITELPFEPSGDRPVFCKDCWAKRRAERGEGRPLRQMIKGNWQCEGCGKEITELPFQPSEDRPIYCKDCWLKKKSQEFDR